MNYSIVLYPIFIFLSYILVAYKWFIDYSCFETVFLFCTGSGIKY